MKKRINRMLALMLAATMVIGGSMTAYACDQCGDGCAKHGNQDGEGTNHGEDVEISYGPSDGGGSGSSGGGSSDSGSSSSASYSDGGSGYSDSGSYDAGSYDAASYDSGSTDSGDAGSVASAPTGLSRKGNCVTIPGHEAFRQVNKASDGRVAIYHCGCEQYTAQLYDANGDAVGYESCGMYKDEASGKWYLNVTTDAKGCTVGTWKGSVDYLSKLGISGVMVNDKLAVEAAAK